MELIYQDRSIVVCVKPAGVLSTDEPGGVPELVRAALGEPHGCVRTVHRLDRVVSGLMVLARTPESASQLSLPKSGSRASRRSIWPWSTAAPQEPEGIFRDLLRRDKAERKTYVTELPGKGVQEAVLTYRAAGAGGVPVSGAHPAANRPHPPDPGSVLRPGPSPGGGPEIQPAGRRLSHRLWSHSLAFCHPATGAPMTFRLDPPSTYPWTVFSQSPL